MLLLYIYIIIIIVTRWAFGDEGGATVRGGGGPPVNAHRVADTRYEVYTRAGHRHTAVYQ